MLSVCGPLDQKGSKGRRQGVLTGGSSAIAVIKPIADEGHLLVALRSLARLSRRTTAARLPEDSTLNGRSESGTSMAAPQRISVVEI